MTPKSSDSVSERGFKFVSLFTRTVGAVICLAMTSLLFTAAATAQALPESRIAIIDYQLIQKNSTAMVEIQKQIEQRRLIYQQEISKQEQELRASDQELVEQRRLIYQQEISKQEQELRASDQELANQRSVLAADAFALKRREFEAKVAQVQRQVQDRKRELDRAFEYGMNQVQLVVKEIIADLAQQRNFNLVLSRQQIIFSENNLNISEDIVKLLNERLPLVQIP